MTTASTNTSFTTTGVTRTPADGAESLKKEAWDRSYGKGDNYLFYPHEEVIRFMSRHVRKRTGLRSFVDRHTLGRVPRVLDLGCGIGRHVRFADDLGLEAHGIDLSEVAIVEAKRICAAEDRAQLAGRFHLGSITAMPYEPGSIDFIVSHGVLDSLPFALAREAIAECRRVMNPKGAFYFDVISGDDSAHHPEFAGEEIVTTAHEQDTVQSYFNFARLEELLAGHFALEECRLIRNESVISPGFHSRYHVVAKPR
jgi:SAM-dependent methyltransferase